jgi:uncharacterized protein (TIGR03118 family)
MSSQRLLQRSKARRVQLRFQPRLETFEERCLLSGYNVTPLVADTAGTAKFTDPHLVNGWGMSSAPGGPFVVSDNNTGFATTYNGFGQPQSLVITIPSVTPGVPGSPSGQVFNPTFGFQVSQGGHKAPSAFLFATEDGTIQGWAPSVNPTSAIIAVNNSAVSPIDYTGLAMAANQDGTFLYVANNAPGGTVEVYDSKFMPAKLQGTFTDPNLPAGFTPYNIQPLGGVLFVTYSGTSGSTLGIVDVFSTQGVFLRRFATGGPLDSPWGVVQAPSDFGAFSNDILIGNEDNGMINAFNPVTGKFLGALKDASGNAIVIDAVWALKFGNDARGGPATNLYFASGPSNYSHGLFGFVSANEDNSALHAGQLVEAMAGVKGIGIAVNSSLATTQGQMPSHAQVQANLGGVVQGGRHATGQSEGLSAEHHTQPGLLGSDWSGLDRFFSADFENVGDSTFR